MSFHLIQLLSAIAGSVGFALLFNVRGSHIFWASSSGFVAWGLYLLFSLHFGLRDFASYTIAAAGLTLYSELLARRLKAPASTFLVIGMIPLLPGGSLYRTLHHAVASNWNAVAGSGIYTLMLAIGIALGIICMMSFMRVLFVSRDALRKYLRKRKL